MFDIEYASPRLAVAIIEDLHVAVHGPDDPNPKDWEGYLNAVNKLLQNHKQAKVLVYTLGGNPSGAQRSELNKINEGLQPLVAVMVDSRIARGAVTALSWFNPSIKAYSLEQLDEAVAHLGLAGARVEQIRETLEQLKAALNSARD